MRMEELRMEEEYTDLNKNKRYPKWIALNFFLTCLIFFLILQYIVCFL